MSVFPFFILWLLIISFDISVIHAAPGLTLPTPNIPEYELQALHNLYDATNGDSWVWKAVSGERWRFTENANPCDPGWKGITCTLPPPYTTYFVQGIDLFAYKLNGTLPNSIGVFSQLQFIDFIGNPSLHGTIPQSIGNLSLLNSFYCGGCSFSGQIPESFGRLSTAFDLAFNNNNFSGTIPSSLGQLNTLQFLYIEDNQLTGPLPATLGSAVSLQFLYAFRNQLSGNIPRTFENLTNLKSLDLSNNQLTGTLPAFLGQLDSLENLVVTQNKLTGTFPSFSYGHSLHFVDISFNDFSGTLPSAFINSFYLEALIMEGCRFTGTIPAAIGNLSKLYSINMGKNLLSGVIPSTMQAMNFKVLLLQNNRLTGSIPKHAWSTVADHSVQFAVTANLLTGPLPDSLCTLYGMRALSLRENYFTSTIPACFMNYSGLQTLDVSLNLLAGFIPEFGHHQFRLQYISVQHNLLTGTLSSSIGEVRALAQLQVFTNFLTGSVPRCFSNASFLSSVQLQSNYFTGTLDGLFLPDVQTRLQTIQFGSNELTGTIPVELFHLSALQTLDLSDNCFSGILDNEVCALTELRALLLDGLSSGRSCQRFLFPGLLDSYALLSTVDGTIPSCVYLLPVLHTLHLSGNGFVGSLPEGNQLTASITELVISHNILSGTIPTSLLSRKWEQLDLSYNRLFGSLPDDDIIDPSFSNDSYQVLSLQSNRLSGRIPNSLKHKERVSMLGTNLFYCRLDHSDLPQHDSDRDTYQCGSDSFTIPYYVWIALITCAPILVLVMRWNQCAQWVELLLKYLRRCAVIEFNEAPYLCHVLGIVRSMLQFSLMVGAYAVVIMTPVYIGLSNYYGTLLHAYGWIVSAAFLSGAVPAAVVATFLLILVAMLIFWSHKRAATLLDTKPMNRQDTSFMGSTPTDVTARSLSRLLHLSEDARDRVIFTLFSSFYVISNCCIVVGTNTAYVYVAIYQSTALLTLAQILMSVFKLLWGNYGTDWLRKSIMSQANTVSDFSKSGLLKTQLIVALLNNVVIPCLVVAAVSPNCFYNVFAPPPQVQTVYSAPTCAAYGLKDCFEYVPIIYTLSYDPPYRYSYQCSSSLVTYYGPAFLTLCLVNTFITPPALGVASFILKNWGKNTVLHRAVALVVPQLLLSPEDSAIKHVNANRLQVNAITFLALLLTFGAVFPPLAAALVVAAVINAYSTRTQIGMLLCAADATNRGEEFTSALNRDCLRSVSSSADVIHSVMWLLIVLSCCFYTLFVFDTLGDAVGIKNAYWVLIVLPLFPLCLYIIYRGAIKMPIWLVNDNNMIAADKNVELESKSSNTEIEMQLRAIGSPASCRIVVGSSLESTAAAVATIIATSDIIIKDNSVSSPLAV